MIRNALVLLALSATVFTHAIHKREPAQIYTKCTRPGTVAVTFDDGPYMYGDDIVDLLDRYDAKATFFLNGKNFRCIYDEDMVAIVRKAHASGHQIASHTWEHMNLATLDYSAIDFQMAKTEEALEKILGVSPAFMRPPYGLYNDLVQQVSGNRNQSLVIWDFDSGDTAAGANPEDVKQNYREIVSRNPQSVLTLNHETVDFVAGESLEFTLSTLKNGGYELVTVAECLGQTPYKAIGTTGQAGTRDESWRC